MSDQIKQATTAPKKPLSGVHQRQPVFALACIVAALFLPDPALGQEEESTTYVSPRQPVNEYLDAIDRIEGDYGPYATELSDMYLGLGQTLMEQGEYEQARDAFHRGVMVVRVNSGPNSPEQTNYLYLLANIETLLGETNTADEILHNIYFINSSYYGKDSPQILPVLARIYHWYLLARPLDPVISDYRDFDRIIELTEEMARVSEVVMGENDPGTALANRRFAEAQFQMVRYLLSEGMILNAENYMTISSGTLFRQDLVRDSVVEHYQAGRKAYTSYLESMSMNESTTALEHAEALADLGDWFLVFEKYRKSREFYEQAYQVLVQSEEYAGLAENFMKLPKPAHFVVNLQPGLLDDMPAELQETSLDISMTITNLGEARHVEVLDPPEGVSKDALRAIKRQVLQTPFRPAMKEGEVVTTKDFIWHYGIVPQEAAS